MDRKYYAFARKCDDGTYEIMCEGIEPKILVASKPGKIREAVKSKNKFTVPELSEELLVDPMYITLFINNPTNGVLDNFKVVKKKVKGKGNKTNVYTRK